jgi:putative tryptophan/tyrosine transport system substrate-binding protein
VFAAAGDPVGMGLVGSLARPGGNVTGLSTLATDHTGKRLELLREVVPGLSRVAVMANAGNPQAVLEMRQVLATAPTLGLEVVTLEIRRSEDIRPPLTRSRGARTDFLLLSTRSYPRTGFALARWRWTLDCRRCTATGTTSKWEV